MGEKGQKSVRRVDGCQVQTRKRQRSVFSLVVGLMVTVVGSLLFVGAVAGWFDSSRAILGAEYSCTGDDCELMELTPDEYEKLIAEKRSFVVLVDQAGCTTADRLKEFMTDYMREQGFKSYKMMFSEMKNSSLHDQVRYYPSVAVIAEGRVLAWLKADSNEDAEAYNQYDTFKEWLQKYLK